MPKIVLIVSIVFTLLFTGCGTVIDNLSVYKPHPIEKAELMPAQHALSGEKFKVVITSVEDKGFKIAQEANLGQALTRMLESEIGRDQSIEILDREATKRFEDEIKLNEMNGVFDDDNTVLQSANYLVVGELQNASFTSRFVQRSTWVSKDGKRYSIPAHYVYTAEVDGQIKIYELPSMKIKKVIAFSDNKKRSEDSKFLGTKVRTDYGLINKAGEDAIYSARIALKNFLAPKGYLIDSRTYDDEYIIKISMGRNNGLKEGDVVVISTKKTIHNELMGTSEVETYKVGEAIISDKIQEKTAWAHLDMEVEGESIHLGDEVKVIYSKDFMDYVNDTGKMLNSFGK